MKTNAGLFDRRNPQYATIWSRESGFTPIHDGQPTPTSGAIEGMDDFEIDCEDKGHFTPVMHRQYADILADLDDALYAWYCYQQEQSEDYDVYFIALTQQVGHLTQVDRDHIRFAFKVEEGDEGEGEGSQSVSVELLDTDDQWTIGITEKLIVDEDLDIESFEDIVVMRIQFNS